MQISIDALILDIPFIHIRDCMTKFKNPDRKNIMGPVLPKKYFGIILHKLT